MNDPLSSILENTTASFLAFRRVGWIFGGQSSVYVCECVAMAQGAFVTRAEVIVWGNLGCCEGDSEDAEEYGRGLAHPDSDMMQHGKQY